MAARLSLERILIIDDHALVRDGLRNLIVALTFDHCVISEAANFATALSILEQGPDFDLVFLDLNIPDISGLDALTILRQKFPSTPILMISGTLCRRVVAECLDAGAIGFVPKTLTRKDLATVLRTVAEGEVYHPDLGDPGEADSEEEAIRSKIHSLTPQQKVVLQHLVKGRLNKQIAYDLEVSMTTVKAHVSAILQKLDVVSRTQAVIMVNRIGSDDSLWKKPPSSSQDS